MGFGNNIRGDDFVFKNYGNRFENIREIVDFDKLKREVYVELVKAIVNNTKKHEKIKKMSIDANNKKSSSSDAAALMMIRGGAKLNKNNEEDFERLVNMNEEWPDHFEERSRPSTNRIEQLSAGRHDAMANMIARPQSLHEYDCRLA